MADQDSHVMLDDEVTVEHSDNSKQRVEADLLVELKRLIPALPIDSELIVVKPDSPTRICTAALTYSNLTDLHLIIVSECKSRIYRHRSNSLPRSTIR
jgi:hypothetical protein